VRRVCIRHCIRKHSRVLSRFVHSRQLAPKKNVEILFKNEIENRNRPREKIFTSLFCATLQTMPRKKKGEQHDRSTQDITQFFGLASPLRDISNDARTAHASASPLAQRPAARNLKLNQIQPSSGARRARQTSPLSQSGEEDLLYSGTCPAVCIVRPCSAL
jgi:hypothetical protein